MGEPFRLIAKFDVGDSYCASKDTLDVVHNLVNTPVGGCHCEYLHEESSSLCFSYAFPNPLSHSHVSPTCSQPPISHEYCIDALIHDPKIWDCNVDLGHTVKMFSMLVGNVDNFLSLGYFCGYDASFDPYCMYLVDNPGKIMWNTFCAVF